MVSGETPTSRAASRIEQEPSELSSAVSTSARSAGAVLVRSWVMVPFWARPGLQWWTCCIHL